MIYSETKFADQLNMAWFVGKGDSSKQNKVISWTELFYSSFDESLFSSFFDFLLAKKSLYFSMLTFVTPFLYSS